MLFQHGQHNIVQVIFITNIVPQPQVKIPHVISLGNVGPDRSIHRKFSVRKGFLKNFTKFARKYLCQSLIFNKVAGLKKRLRYRCFSVNFVNLLQNTTTSWEKMTLSRSTCSQMLFKIGVLKNFTSFTGKHSKFFVHCCLSRI